MGGPIRAGGPQPGEVIREGRIHLTVSDVQADRIVTRDAKGKGHTIRLDPGVRFNWDADRDCWVMVG